MLLRLHGESRSSMKLKFTRIHFIAPVPVSGKIYYDCADAVLDTETNLIDFPLGGGTFLHNCRGFEGSPVPQEAKATTGPRRIKVP